MWLDYCGTLSLLGFRLFRVTSVRSGPGQRRQADIARLFTAKLLGPRALLAVTVSERGAARLYRRFRLSKGPLSKLPGVS